MTQMNPNTMLYIQYFTVLIISEVSQYKIHKQGIWKGKSVPFAGVLISMIPDYRSSTDLIVAYVTTGN